MNSSESLLLQNMKDAFINIWLWIPLAIIVFYVLINNNSWKRIVINLFSFLSILILSIWIERFWGEEKNKFISIFFAIGCFLFYLIQSRKLLFSILLSFIGLCVFYPDLSLINKLIQGLLISGAIFILNRFITIRVFKERKSYISVEYTKGGYRVGDVNVLILFWFLTLYFVLIVSLYNLIGL